jgi:hypothetical protein
MPVSIANTGNIMYNSHYEKATSDNLNRSDVLVIAEHFTPVSSVEDRNGGS